MAIDTGEIRSILKDLAQICKDGEEGFREAAEKLTRTDLKSQFLTYSSQRGKFASELWSEISKMGGEPDTGGTVTGAIHRGWLNLKEKLSGHDDAAIVSEAERGEDVAKKAYQDALSKDLPSDIRSRIEAQFQQVLQTHNAVRSLEVRMGHA